jgi:hypothetical protein
MIIFYLYNIIFIIHYPYVAAQHEARMGDVARLLAALLVIYH